MVIVLFPGEQARPRTFITILPHNRLFSWMAPGAGQGRDLNPRLTSWRAASHELLLQAGLSWGVGWGGPRRGREKQLEKDQQTKRELGCRACPRVSLTEEGPEEEEMGQRVSLRFPRWF